MRRGRRRKPERRGTFPERQAGAGNDVIARARAAGTTILKEPQPADFGGYHAYFADLDGHRWDAVHNPGLLVSDDGTVMIGPVDD